jgi:hypothetical protein
LSEVESEGDPGQAGLYEDEHEQIWHPEEVLRDVREGSYLSQQKDHEDHEELSAHQELFYLR